MKSARQTSLFHDKIHGNVPRFFGGSLLKGNPKRARPITTKHAIHLVLKSKLATGKRSFLAPFHVKEIDRLIRRFAEKNRIKIYHFVNVGNHIHLVIKIDHATCKSGQRAYAKFIRTVSGLIARKVLGAERNNAINLKFWQARPFTRIISWGREYARVARYMMKNIIESAQRRIYFDFGFSVINSDAFQFLETG